MRALTLYQPWASLIMTGVKHFETRSWATDYRGPLAIHAGKLTQSQVFARVGLSDWLALDAACVEADLPYIVELPRGCILGTVELVDCLQVYEPQTFHSRATIDPWDSMSDLEMSLGDYTPGRYAWVLRDPKPLPEPIPCRGAQRLWTVPADVAERMVTR